MSNRKKFVLLLSLLIFGGDFLVSTLHSSGITRSPQMVDTQSSASITSVNFLTSATPSLLPTPKSHSTSKPPKKKISVKKVSTGTTLKSKIKSRYQTVPLTNHKINVSAPSEPLPLPTASATNSTDTTSPYGVKSDTYITTPPDWTGFVVPTASFVSVVSCVKSPILEQSLISTQSYPYIVSEKWKLTGGNFNIYDLSVRGYPEFHHYTPNDTYYVTFKTIFFTNNMDLTDYNSEDFAFLPFNQVPYHSFPQGTADTERDITLSTTSIYTQSECTE